MAYPSGMLDQIVEIHNLTEQVADKFGAGSGQYAKAAEVHANVKYSKGAKSLREEPWKPTTCCSSVCDGTPSSAAPHASSTTDAPGR